MVGDIKLIRPDTNIQSLKIHRYDWDVWVKGKPYYVVRIEGYNHSIVGMYNGQNDLWMYPRDEEPSYENLTEYSTRDFGVLWGYRYEPYNYIRAKYDEAECFTCHRYIITRNGMDFYDDCHGIHDVMTKIQRLNDHPIPFNLINWKDEVIGRKIWWRSQPGIITHWVDGQACVIIKPDGIDKFETPQEYKNDGLFSDDEEDIKADVFSSHIYWFRD